MVERCSEAKRPRRELPRVARSSLVSFVAGAALPGPAWSSLSCCAAGTKEGCVRHVTRADWRAGDGLRERRDASAERAVGGGTREGSGGAREREAWWKARGGMRGAASARRARRRAGREGMAAACFSVGARSSEDENKKWTLRPAKKIA